MIFQHLSDVQELAIRAYVRNVMFFATLPYHIAQARRRHNSNACGAKPSEATDE